VSPESGDRIIEIGCFEMIDRRLSGRTLHRFVNPQRRSHDDAIKVHGLTEEFLAAKPLFGEIADELLAFVAGAEIVIHNAAFDIGFLDAELRRIGRPMFASHDVRVVDSQSLARESFPGKANSLDALCKRFEVNNAGRELHGALLDAGLLAEVYIRMTRGQDSLVIDGYDGAGHDHALEAVDFGALALRVVLADDDELAAHAALLDDLRRRSGVAVWAAEAAVT